MNIRKLPSGNYRAVVAAGCDEKGKRLFRSFTAPTEWEVMKLVEDFKEGCSELSDLNITVSQAMEAYIATRANVIEQTTVRHYRQLAKHRFKCIQNKKLSVLRTMDIQKAVNDESARVSPKYVKNAYGFLKSVLKMHGVKLNLDSIKLPKLVKKERELASFAEIFSIVRGTEIELPVLLAAWMSLRIGEVTGLQFQDVDIQNKQLRVRRTIIMTENGDVVREGCKTEKSVRTLRLPEYILGLIEKTPHKKETDFIVPLTRKAVYSRFIRLMNKHGISMTFHDLRHLNASVMLMLGVPDKYAMERGGWATDHILKSVYQQTFSSERKRVDDTIDCYFSGVIETIDDTEMVDDPDISPLLG